MELDTGIKENDKQVNTSAQSLNITNIWKAIKKIKWEEVVQGSRHGSTE